MKHENAEGNFMICPFLVTVELHVATKQSIQVIYVSAVQGSSGSYFAKNVDGEVIGVFKPKVSFYSSQCCRSGSKFDPYSANCWIRIRIQNLDPDPYSEFKSGSTVKNRKKDSTKKSHCQFWTFLHAIIFLYIFTVIYTVIYR